MITNVIKKHLGDILLTIGVFAVFFLTGTSKNKPVSFEPESSSISEQSSPSTNTEVGTLKNENQAGPAPIIPIAPRVPPTEQSNIAANPVQAPPSQTNNPYAALMNRQGANNNGTIQNSLNNLKGEAPSTEALIERNTYFKKLSDQLKDLQGSVNTDEEGSKDNENAAASENSNEDTSNEEEEADLGLIEEQDGPGSEENLNTPE